MINWSQKLSGSIAFLALLSALASTPQPAAAQVAPAGTEFQINTYTSGTQILADVCKAPNGDFVVVWTSYEDIDGDQTGIFGQRYGSSGGELGSEFQINSFTTGGQTVPAICCDAAGDFVVVWHSAVHDGDFTGVFGQRFASGGQFRGTEFQVNTYTPSIQANADVCCSATGDFVVAWRSVDQDGSEAGIFAQRFAPTGGFSGTEFRVNSYTLGSQEGAQLCCSAAGDFTVVWDSYDQDGASGGIFGQRFASAGTAAGTEFQVNVFTASSQRLPTVCCDEIGDFTVAWSSSQQDGAGDGIFGQRFDSAGGRRGPEFLVNTYTSGNEIDPSICCGAEGAFVVAWTANYQDGGGTDEYAIVARRFTGFGGASSEFLVNTYTTGVQLQPAVACDEKGGFVVVWSSISDQDGDNSGIFGQRFELLGVVPTPALSFAGLAIGVIALVGAGVSRLRRRRPR